MAVRIPGCSADGSALEWGSRGRWFKSSHSDQNAESVMISAFSFLFSSEKQRAWFLKKKEESSVSLRKRISAKSSASAEEEFKRFIIAKMAKGLADKTLKTYQQHLSAISKHLDLRQSIEKLNTNNLEQMIVSMREAGLSSNGVFSIFPCIKIGTFQHLNKQLFVTLYFHH